MKRTGWRAAAIPLLSVAIEAGACGGSRPSLVPPTPPPLIAVDALHRDIENTLASPTLNQGICAVAVRSLETGDTIYSLNADKLLLPSSTMKLLTLATAADRLGWDYVFDTKVSATGPVDAGVLDGDLVVVGDGDPSIDNWSGDAARLFREWSDALKAAGIRHVGGRVVGDDHAFDDEGIGAGWMWDDLDRSFATGVGALQFNENTAQITVLPGESVGDAAKVSFTPTGAELIIRNDVNTAARGSNTLIATERRPGQPTLDVRGSIPLGSVPIVRNVAVLHPTRYFVNELRAALIVNGIDVSDPAFDIDELSGAPPSPTGTALIEHHSPPLGMLGSTMMKLSQNLYAETLLRAIGRSAGTPTAAGGISVVRSTLAGWGIPATGYIQVDGSGLSRYDFVTANTLVAILAHVENDSRLRDRFRSVLPVAGRDGTLENRMKGTAAEGTVLAKTGSMTNARALAGYASDRDGERLAFAVIANNFGASPEAALAVDRAIDAIAVRLAGFSRK